MTLHAPSRNAVRAADPAAPRRAAIIMDGNGRWANERGRPRLSGRKAGAGKFHRVLRAFHERGVDFVTR